MTSPLLSIQDAAAALKSGSVIAYPTEAVWGLACDPRNEDAVLRLLAIKQRAVEKGLILIASHLDQLRPYLELASVPTDNLAAVLATWPGPHTWVMPATGDAPRWITGTHDGIAVRVSAHPVVIALCEAFGRALVSTSANVASEPAPRTRAELDPRIAAGVDAVCIGETSGLSQPTAIRDARDGRTLR